MERLRRHAERRWRDRCKGVEVTFRGAHGYVGVLVRHTWFVPGTSKAEQARIRATLVPLCRLRYLGQGDRWGFSFHQASRDRYEPSFMLSGSSEGTPEECFDCAAGLYLAGPW